MKKTIFHPSIEGGQHGTKGLEGFLDFAMESGAAGAQPSIYMFEDGKGGFISAQMIQEAFQSRSLKLDGISMHPVFWSHTTAWTHSPTIRPFIPATLWDKSSADIEQWTEDYLFKAMDLAAELGILIVPMFWGISHGWELATGYPWGFFSGPGYDLIKKGNERFVSKTEKIRQHANSLGIVLAHEIHPSTAAMCADDFLMLVRICDKDPCLGVNVDPSHCWEGETWRTRFLKVADYCYGCHVKNYVIQPDFPLRLMEGDWQKRGMQFCDLPTGDLNLTRFVELMVQIGYPQRYCEKMGTETAPLVAEAESAFRDLDLTSAGGIQYIRDHLCFDLAGGSFEDGIGN